ncbi:MAG: fumarylacetoacetate hydrolase family protein [Hymenobacter sp.]
MIFELEVLVQPAGATAAPLVISRTNMRHLYWSMAQQLTHHASNGCPLAVGDIYASGTISGPTPGALGCLLELTQRGQQPPHLPGGVELGFLRDGDTVILRALRGAGVGAHWLGEVSGAVLPAVGQLLQEVFTGKSRRFN